MDTVSSEVRSRMMAAVRQKNTEPELDLRRALHGLGFRFKLNDRSLPGSPDIIFPKYRAAVFVHGCFWHAHRDCRLAKLPKSRPEFWEEKFRANRERDQRKIQQLLDAGWRVAVVWQCSIKGSAERLFSATSGLSDWMRDKSNSEQFLEIGSMDTDRIHSD